MVLLRGQVSIGGLLNNFEATTNPTVNDDSTLRYSVGSRWVNLTNDTIWTLVDATVGGAIWKLVSERLWNEEEFTPTTGQITFIVANMPADAVSIEFYVNGVLADRGAQYTASGATFTWLNNPYSLVPRDLIQIRYK